ncbi:hypothetical protein ISF9_041 [Microbacterium phage vB_MoxS-ISF9]|uniref:Uncharacterized protein n=1 Tax=Microbacterium phage vB_MoxS-ISF9 TaxID=1458670 RepID=W8PF73_9CAUD|nr:hypothetical protein ISF9_041 [Microbacterium phage vB_MoxS-ISF9]AHL18511.1 hypothetical protein ISF9_041 [Microbacterium phage vB_MoxS-ISF9]
MTEQSNPVNIERSEVGVGDKIEISRIAEVLAVRKLRRAPGLPDLTIIEFEEGGVKTTTAIGPHETVKRFEKPIELPDDALVITWKLENGRRYYATKWDDGEWVDSEEDPIGEDADEVIGCIRGGYDSDYVPGSFEVLKSKPKDLAAGGYVPGGTPTFAKIFGGGIGTRSPIFDPLGRTFGVAP